MIICYITNGNSDRIPSIGSKVKLKEYVNFVVDAYGESQEIDYPDSPTGKAYKIELIGHLLNGEFL